MVSYNSFLGKIVKECLKNSLPLPTKISFKKNPEKILPKANPINGINKFLLDS